MSDLKPASDEGTVEELAALLDGLRVVALTGAGCSTESGIPDYRGPETKRRARNPIRYQDFVGTDEMRARYWARSMVGWPKMYAAQPNDGHRALAAMEMDGSLIGTITQNVDGLHTKAGSQNVVELHGALAEVRCLSCEHLEPRAQLQMRLLESNSAFDFERVGFAPDGDADLGAVDYSSFAVPRCSGCGDVQLKPNVVFFGESVPARVVDDAFAMMEEAEALLVVGSSLTVYSGLRFVRFASEPPSRRNTEFGGNARRPVRVAPCGRSGGRRPTRPRPTTRALTYSAGSGSTRRSRYDGLGWSPSSPTLMETRFRPCCLAR